MSKKLHLYVWGPGFGLPSVEVECLAAILFLNGAVPVGEWTIHPVASHAASKYNTLPVLRRGTKLSSGYNAIVNFLITNDYCKEGRLTAEQSADGPALVAYLNASVRPLLDLSLYVSPSNWATATRPALSAVIPWPFSWIEPPLLRAAAVARVERRGWGLPHSDADADEHDAIGAAHDPDRPGSVPRDFAPPPGLDRRAGGVLARLAPEQVSAVSLAARADAALAPLEALVPPLAVLPPRDDGPRREYNFDTPGTYWFAFDQPGMADCLVTAYLALIDVPGLPRPWLRQALDRHERLSWYLRRMRRAHMSFDVAELPWERGTMIAPRPQSVFTTLGAVLHALLVRVPVIGGLYEAERRRRLAGEIHGPDRRTWSALGVGLCAAFGLVGAWHLYRTPFGAALQVWRADRPRARLADFGALGAMLGYSLGESEGAAEAPPIVWTRAAVGGVAELD